MASITSSLLVVFAALIASFEGPAQMVCLAILLALFASGQFNKYRPSLVEGGLLLWVLAGFGSLLIHGPAPGTEGMLRPVISVTFLVGVLGFAQADERTLKRAAIAFAAACVVNGLYGYIQVFIADPPFEEILAGRLRSQNLIDPKNTAQLTMATGLFYSRLKLAHVGVVGLALLGLMAGQRPKKTLWPLLGGIVLAGAVFLTYRRAAPFALILSGVGLAVIMGRVKTATSSLLAGAAVIACFVFSDYGRERLLGFSQNWDERVQIYSHCLDLIRSNFFLGVGHGGYQRAILEIAPNMSRDLTTSPHNLFLHVIVETGLLGFLGFCTAVIAASGRLIRRIRSEGQAHEAVKTADRFAFLGLSCILIIGSVHASLHHVPVSLLFWTLLGIAARKTGEKTSWPPLVGVISSP
jgi:hypothetical protein